MGFWDFADKHTFAVGLWIFFICWGVGWAAEGLGPKKPKGGNE